MFFDQFFQRMKKIFLNTPLNQKYISDVSLKKSILFAKSYSKGRLLDVGCGEKKYRSLFQDKVTEHIGLDYPSCYFEDPKIDVFGDAHCLPFSADSFDTILCSQVLLHLKNPFQVFEEFGRCLKKKSYLIVTATKTHPVVRCGPEYFRFTEGGLKYLAEQAKLNVVYIKPICGFPATIGQYLTRYVYGTFLINNKTKKPIVWLYPIVSPFCAVIQLFFLALDKMHNKDSWETDTLCYILVAKKE